MHTRRRLATVGRISSHLLPEQHNCATQIEQERITAPPPPVPAAEGNRQRGREGIFLRRDSMIAAHDGLISRSRSFAPDRHDPPSAQYAAMEGEQLVPVSSYVLACRYQGCLLRA